MLCLFCRHNLDEAQKEIVRAEVKQKTGEDCLILGPDFYGICFFQGKKEKAVPPHKRLPWLFKS